MPIFWEYLVETRQVEELDSKEERWLSELGGHGWELILVLPVPSSKFVDCTKYIFKRPR